MKDGWQKGQKAAPICVGGPPVPRRHRQHHLFRRWLQRWPWPVTLAIVAIREGNELTLVQLGLSYFTPSGPSLAPCLPAGDLKKPSRCRAPREPWWWAPAVVSADSGEHCSWYVQKADALSESGPAPCCSSAGGPPWPWAAATTTDSVCECPDTSPHLMRRHNHRDGTKSQPAAHSIPVSHS